MLSMAAARKKKEAGLAPRIQLERDFVAHLAIVGEPLRLFGRDAALADWRAVRGEPLHHTKHGLRLWPVLSLHLGGLQFDERHRVGVNRTDPRDLIAECDNRAAAAAGSGYEGVELGRTRILEQDRSGLLPRILRFAIKADVPFVSIVVTERIALRQFLAGLTQDVLHDLAALPTSPIVQG